MPQEMGYSYKKGRNLQNNAVSAGVLGSEKSGGNKSFRKTCKSKNKDC
jgi:hypothetical protein